MKIDRFKRLGILAAIGAALVMTSGGVLAQDATPTAKAPIVEELLASGMPVDAPGKVLMLERYTLQPGALIPTHTHPGAYAIYVAAGTLEFSLISGEAIVMRAGATSPEPIAVGAKVIVNTGDSVFENGGVVHSAANAGDDELVLLTSALLSHDMAPLQPTNDEGTPVA